ncbi:hypothetical protein QTP88_010962 [Uroleucon formosanum]
MVNFLLGQQGGYTKYPCFLCLWNSRARQEHWIKKSGLREKTWLLEKLGLMKQFIKALDHDSPCFAYTVQKMRGVSSEKFKAGILNGSQIRQLINDSHFVDSMNEKEGKAWMAFILVVNNFLGNKNAENYVELVETMSKKNKLNS